MSITETINNDLKEAMKARDKERLEALRAVKTAITMQLTEKGGVKRLSEADELKIVQKQVKQRKDAAEIYSKQNRADLAEKELTEAKILEKYLPEMLSGEKLDEALKSIIEDIGASNPSDMGRVMGAANKILAGKAEGRDIAARVKAILNS